MTTRTVAVTAAVVGAAVLATTGITYASAAGSAPAAPSVQQAAPAPGPAAGDGNGNGGNGNGGRGGDEGGFGGGGGGGRGGDGGGFGGGAAAVAVAATAAASVAAVAVASAAVAAAAGRGGGGGGGGFGGGGGSAVAWLGDDGGYGGYDKGRIHINERSYSAQPDGCITVVSGLGSRSFNVRNDSRRTVELFRGATCDNGSPVATVGPWSTSNGVFTRQVRGGVKVQQWRSGQLPSGQGPLRQQVVTAPPASHGNPGPSESGRGFRHGDASRRMPGFGRPHARATQAR